VLSFILQLRSASYMLVERSQPYSVARTWLKGGQKEARRVMYRIRISRSVRNFLDKGLNDYPIEADLRANISRI
jgi:hypothetical protein